MNNYIKAEFLNFKFNPDGHLIKLIEKLIIHKLCEEQNPSSSYMKFNKYSSSICFKHYFKFLQFEIIVYKNSYLLYHHKTDEHKVIK